MQIWRHVNFGWRIALVVTIELTRQKCADDGAGGTAQKNRFIAEGTHDQPGERSDQSQAEIEKSGVGSERSAAILMWHILDRFHTECREHQRKADPGQGGADDRHRRRARAPQQALTDRFDQQGNRRHPGPAKTFDGIAKQQPHTDEGQAVGRQCIRGIRPAAAGIEQGGLTLSYDNWWTLNDLFYFSFNHDLGGSNHGDHGAHGHTMHYSLPFGYWQLGLTQSANQYHQEVAGFSQTYRYHGKSENTELKLTRLLWRNATHKTSISLKGLLRSASNYIDDTEVSPQRRRTTAWELSLQHRIFIQRASVEGALSYRHGTGAFGALRAPEEDFNEGTSRFRIITTDLALTAPFALNLPWGAQTLRYNGTVRAQWNETPLTPQDRFTIGGRYSVRGFDGEYVLAAERGWLVRNELSAALGSSGQEFYLGADYGEVAGRSAALLLGTRLAGAVAGMRGVIGGFAWDGFAGAPLHRPEGFKSAAVSAGFTLNWTF